jgi:hypothetical protein
MERNKNMICKRKQNDKIAGKIRRNNIVDRERTFLSCNSINNCDSVFACTCLGRSYNFGFISGFY